MIGRALVVWLLLLVLAFAGAALREGLLAPRIGADAAHVVGTIVVVAAFLTAIALTLPWVVPTLAPGALLRLGLGWTALTMVFEFGFGHFVMGHSWGKLLHDYDIFAGRVWILVLLTTLLGPWLLGRMQAGG
ncbi:MAG TPA: hypothetical protein VKA44_03970 [Gemmatimonadota bacterium]|nr:hypothetical protein [Gemmatimonadota bacterium]